MISNLEGLIMKLRSLLIILIIVIALIPFYYINRWLQRVIRPRDSAGQFVIFVFANFVLVIVYTITLVGLVSKLFPHH